MRITPNQQRVNRIYAVIKGDAGRRYGRELDSWLPYWERHFASGESVPRNGGTANQWRLNRLMALLRRSRGFRRLLDRAVPALRTPIQTGATVL